MNAKPVRDPNDGSSGNDDPRLAFVYQEAVRGLVHQQNIVESLNNRAGSLIFATAFVTSLLGTNALADGVGFWDWVALALLFLIGVLTVFMLWPYYNYTFRFDPEELLDRYVDGDVAASIGGMHRTLASGSRPTCWRIGESSSRFESRCRRRSSCCCWRSPHGSSRLEGSERRSRSRVVFDFSDEGVWSHTLGMLETVDTMLLGAGMHQEYSQHPVEHRKRVTPRTAAAVRPPLLFEQRLDDRPLLVGRGPCPSGTTGRP